MAGISTVGPGMLYECYRQYSIQALPAERAHNLLPPEPKEGAVAPKPPYHTRPAAADTGKAANIRLMRATLADLELMTDQTMALLGSTRDALRRADDLLARSISGAVQRPLT
jgi:hypothetical protein